MKLTELPVIKGIQCRDESGGTGPPKPDEGAPCNGCGFCCAAVVCPVGRDVFKTDVAPCPGLEFDAEGSRFWCGLARDPKKYGLPVPVSAMKFVLGIETGVGCDTKDPRGLRLP